MQYTFGVLIGLVSGITSGLFGVGGGVVMVPIMVFLLKMDIKLAVGTSLLVIIPTAVTGAMKHGQLGNIDWRLGIAIIPTAMIGSYFGAWFTSTLSSASLKRMFGGFLMLVGLRLVLGK